MLWECFWGHFWPKAALQLSLSVRLRTSCEGSKLQSFQCRVLYRPTELRAGPQRMRRNTRAPRSLCHAARLETSWPGQSGYAIWLQWCQFVSIRYLIKGAWCVAVWAIVGAMLQRLIFCGGNCPHCPWGSPVPLPMATDRDQRTRTIAYAALSILLYGSTAKKWSGHGLTGPTGSYAYDKTVHN